MRIGELAARTGVSVRALRYYEEQSLLGAERSAGGQRQYPESAVDRIRLIQQLYAAGLSSRTIVELLPCVVDGKATPELLDRLASERDRIDRQIADLLGTRDRLDSVLGGAARNLRTGQPCQGRADAAGLSERASDPPRSR
ncbi:MerR family transcriptional regulator [Streptomyces sp. SCSIO ZS0520]|uniref:MerR family transcriptional regulator n=1 Tax=Streptomyces sp. SCSIO ZS0520 TaxID=2892996 RepID=UPI0021DB01D4|nr:MerR family transcriptional regulator [Streptomyces sp. SCSIO ZS0520]